MKLYSNHLKKYNITLPVQRDEHIYYRFVVGLENDCTEFIQKFTPKAVGCECPVYLPFHRHLKMDGYPITDNAWETSLSIPIYPSLGNSEIEQIIDRFIGVYEKYQRSAAG